MDERDVELEALRREVERLKQLVRGIAQYHDLILDDDGVQDYGAPLPEEYERA